MDSESATEPGVITRVELQPENPSPADVLPPGEVLRTTVELSPGWIAATDREILTYHPDRDPAMVRTPRHNVTGIAVRRAGGRRFVGYVPLGLFAAVGALAVGLGLLAVTPSQFVTMPDGTAGGQLATIVETLGWAMNLLGSVLVFIGILTALTAVVVVGYWLASRDVTLIIERGGADPVECPTTRQRGQEAVRELRESLA